MPEWAHLAWAWLFVLLALAIPFGLWWSWQRPWPRAVRVAITAILVPVELFLVPGLLYLPALLVIAGAG